MYCVRIIALCILNIYRLSQSNFTVTGQWYSYSLPITVVFRRTNLFRCLSSISTIAWRSDLGTWSRHSHMTCRPRFWGLIESLQRMAEYSKYLLIGVPVAVLVSCAVLWLREKQRRRSFKEVGRVSGLFVYPVKSCKGIRVRDIKCFKEGMEYDRWDFHD